MKNNNLRPGIAMIELIFALVIMAIALMSAPMLISTATKSGFVAVQQEGINEAAARVSMVMGYHWDENDANESYLDPILGVSASADTGLKEYNSTGRRIGTPLVSQRSFIRSDGTKPNASTTLKLETSDLGITDDIDDFNGTSYLVPIEIARINYVEKTTINISTEVSNISDSPGSGSYANAGVSGNLVFSPNLSSTVTPTRNIKKILVTLTSTSGVTELDKEIVLKAFSCNIGAYDLKEREF